MQEPLVELQLKLFEVAKITNMSNLQNKNLYLIFCLATVYFNPLNLR